MLQPKIGEDEAVILRPVDPLRYVREGSSKEPQYTTSISPVSSKVYASSFDAEQVGPTSYLVRSGQNLGTGFRRIRLVSCDMIWPSCCVNESNNTLRIIWPNTTESKEYIIPVSDYSSIDDVLDTDPDTLKYKSLLWGINERFQADPLYDIEATAPIPSINVPIDDAGEPFLTFSSSEPFYVDPNCSFYKFGKALYGLTSDILQPRSDHVIGPITYNYTQWVDVCSAEITKNQKMRTISTNNVSNILARIPISEATQGERIVFTPPTYLACARNSTDPLYQFDLIFLDQFGNQISRRTNDLINNVTPSPAAFSWYLTLELEV